ncbi:hypothetical protein [Vallitalea guaymasensis]|uniref:hypothetical protein n=1 Tax=Vallitalea guaymasensis TaxID=1185412 RepID=UPI000DE4E637|nr:hypothetical protein [Vallitalea guaymasensis]
MKSYKDMSEILENHIDAEMKSPKEALAKDIAYAMMKENFEELNKKLVGNENNYQLVKKSQFLGGTKIKVSMKLEVESYCEQDLRDILSKIATNSQQFYLYVGNEIKNKP